MRRLVAAFHSQVIRIDSGYRVDAEVEKLGIVPKPSPLVGTELADFSLKDSEGRDFTLSGLRGRVVLLDFWATWCGSCLVELPSIEKLHREFKDQGLVVLGVNNEDAAKNWV